jgi:peptide/nickel transport system permease protein
MRSLVVSLLGEDYLIFARTKGLTKRRIFSRYILRNALLPQITALAMSLGFIMNGFILVEWVFSYPGIGYLFSEALKNLDYNVAFGCTLITTIVVTVSSFLIEFLYPLFDPRVRLGT